MTGAEGKTGSQEEKVMLSKKSEEAHSEKSEGYSDCWPFRVEGEHGKIPKSKLLKGDLEMPLEITYSTFHIWPMRKHRLTDHS